MTKLVTITNCNIRVKRHPSPASRTNDTRSRYGRVRGNVPGRNNTNHCNNSKPIRNLQRNPWQSLNYNHRFVVDCWNACYYDYIRAVARHKNEYSRKIIVCISIGDFFVACSNILGVWEREMDHWKSACEIQAAIGMVAVLSTFFWTVYLSVYFYLVISKKISVDSERRIMLWFHFTGWGIPLAITAIAKEKGATGYSGDLVSSGWCWISSDQPWWKMLLWMVIAGKGWEILAYITISVFYVLIKLSIRREVQ